MSDVGEGSYEEYVGTEGYDELERLVGEILDNKIGGEGIFSTLDEINDYSVRLDKSLFQDAERSYRLHHG